MTTQTPEQFMTTLSTDEDYPEYDTNPQTPLESIAESLRVLAAATEPGHKAMRDDPLVEEYQAVNEALADLEDKHRALFDLLADVEKIVKPSTSKLANAVRNAITEWRAPEVPELNEAPNAGIEHLCPAADAPLEDWREFAYAVQGAAPDPGIATMNRSQIRTLLGLPHFESTISYAPAAGE